MDSRDPRAYTGPVAPADRKGLLECSFGVVGDPPPAFAGTPRHHGRGSAAGRLSGTWLSP